MDGAMVAPPSAMRPYALGLTYGLLHAAGPDHLGTLAALSAACGSPWRAFPVGALWAVGHCAGMALAGLLLAMLQRVAFDAHMWHKAGDVVIGVSMMLCGAYFLCREADYFLETPEGSATLRPCECCGDPTGYGAVAKSATVGRRKDSAEGGLAGHARAPELCCPSFDGKGDAAFQPPPPRAPAAEARGAWTRGQDAASAALGVLQGMCCPLGLVGIASVTSLPPAGAVAFCTTFLLCSALATGLLAAAWSAATTMGPCSRSCTRWLYRASCALTVSVGLVWIVAMLAGVSHGHDHSGNRLDSGDSHGTHKHP